MKELANQIPSKELDNVKYELGYAENALTRQKQRLLFKSTDGNFEIISAQTSAIQNIDPQDIANLAAKNFNLDPEIASIQAQSYTSMATGLTTEYSSMSFAPLSKAQATGFKILGHVEKIVGVLPFGRFLGYGAKVGRYAVALSPINRSGMAWNASLKWSPSEGGGLTWSRAGWLGLSDIAASIHAIQLADGSGEAKAEVPLKGTTWCELCNWDNYTACTESRCKMLGQCVYKAVPDQRGGLCLPAACAEGYPKISQINASFMIDATRAEKTSTSKGCPDGKGACSVNAGEISFNVSSIRVFVATEQYAECRYIVDKKGANFSEMELIEHDIEMPKTRGFSIDISNLERGREHYIFFKCKGPCGDESTHPPGFDWNYIKFKIEDYPDWLPPSIVVDPNDKETAIPDSRSFQEIYIYLDKKGTCGYSTKNPKLNLTKNFFLDKDCSDSMQSGEAMCHFGSKLSNDNFILGSGCNTENKCKKMTSEGLKYTDEECTKCFINISLADAYADILDWDELKASLDTAKATCSENPQECEGQVEIGEGKSLNLADITNSLDASMMEGKNKFFRLNFRCANDQGYAMPEEETYEYTLLTSPSYNITILSPYQNMQSYKRDVEIKINTSNVAICKYSLDVDKSYEEMDWVVRTFGLLHNKIIEGLSKGEHTLYVKCRNYFNIEEEAQVSFSIVPAPLPQVIRIFADSNKLFIETDIESNCIYNLNESSGCDFDNSTETAQSFSNLNDFMFETYPNEAPTYYVKCIDFWQDNSWPQDCVIIRPFELPSI